MPNIYYKNKKSSNLISTGEEKLLFKYSINPYCKVLLNDIRLDKSLTFINDNTVRLNVERRRKYMCYICMLKFSSLLEVKKHKRIHKRQELNDDKCIEQASQKENIKVNNNESKYEMSVSTKEQKSDDRVAGKGAYKETTKGDSTDGVPDKLSPKNSGNFQEHLLCQTCNVSFKNLLDLKTHNSVKNKCIFFCVLCKQHFKDSSTFLLHVTNHKNYKFESDFVDICKFQRHEQCFNDCSQVVKDEVVKQSSLPRETSEKLLDPLSHCNVSDHNDKTENNVHTPLQVHNVIKTKTDNQLTHFSCDLCFDVFSDKDDLKVHMDFHKQLQKDLNFNSVDDEDEILEIIENEIGLKYVSAVHQEKTSNCITEYTNSVAKDAVGDQNVSHDFKHFSATQNSIDNMHKVEISQNQIILQSLNALFQKKTSDCTTKCESSTFKEAADQQKGLPKFKIAHIATNSIRNMHEVQVSQNQITPKSLSAVHQKKTFNYTTECTNSTAKTAAGQQKVTPDFKNLHPNSTRNLHKVEVSQNQTNLESSNTIHEKKTSEYTRKCTNNTAEGPAGQQKISPNFKNIQTTLSSSKAKSSQNQINLESLNIVYEKETSDYTRKCTNNTAEGPAGQQKISPNFKNIQTTLSSSKAKSSQNQINLESLKKNTSDYIRKCTNNTAEGPAGQQKISPNFKNIQTTLSSSKAKSNQNQINLESFNIVYEKETSDYTRKCTNNTAEGPADQQKISPNFKNIQTTLSSSKAKSSQNQINSKSVGSVYQKNTTYCTNSTPKIAASQQKVSPDFKNSQTTPNSFLNAQRIRVSQNQINPKSSSAIRQKNIYDCTRVCTKNIATVADGQQNSSPNYTSTRIVQNPLIATDNRYQLEPMVVVNEDEINLIKPSQNKEKLNRVLQHSGLSKTKNTHKKVLPGCINIQNKPNLYQNSQSSFSTMYSYVEGVTRNIEGNYVVDNISDIVYVIDSDDTSTSMFSIPPNNSSAVINNTGLNYYLIPSENMNIVPQNLASLNPVSTILHETQQKVTTSLTEDSQFLEQINVCDINGLPLNKQTSIVYALPIADSIDTAAIENNKFSNTSEANILGNVGKEVIPTSLIDTGKKSIKKLTSSEPKVKGDGQKRSLLKKWLLQDLDTKASNLTANNQHKNFLNPLNTNSLRIFRKKKMNTYVIDSSDIISKPSHTDLQLQEIQSTKCIQAKTKKLQETPLPIITSVSSLVSDEDGSEMSSSYTDADIESALPLTMIMKK